MMAAAKAAFHQAPGQLGRPFEPPPQGDVVSPWAPISPGVARPPVSAACRGLTSGEAVLLRPREPHSYNPEPPPRQHEAGSAELHLQPDVRRAETAPALRGQGSRPNSATALTPHEVRSQGTAGAEPHRQHRHSHEGRRSLDALEGRRSLEQRMGMSLDVRLPDRQAVATHGTQPAGAAPGPAPDTRFEDSIRVSSEFLHMLKTMEVSAAPNPGHGGREHAAREVPAAPRVASATDQENAYLRKNVEHLRHSKRILEAQVVSLESRARSLDQQNQQYKDLYEQSKACLMMGNGGELEISNLHQQLTAVLMLKDALNTENIELQRKLQAAQAEAGNESKHTACVICMDNLANVVCLPCKHLSLCTFCSQQEGLSNCPICRSDISAKLQIYMP